MDEKSVLGDKLLDLADVIELRRPVLPPDLPDKPLVFHWHLGTVQEDFLPTLKKEKIPEFINEIQAGLFSFDLGPACRRNDHILPLSPTLDRSGIKKISSLAVDQVRRVYRGKLALENYAYYPTGMYEHVCRPDFIGEFLEASDLGLVLDLAHALVSAANLNLEPEQYIREMPLERLVEIHLSRPYYHPGLAVDAHDPPQEGEFELLANILKSLPGQDRVMVVIEYYRDLERMLELHKRLVRILKTLNKSKPT